MEACAYRSLRILRAAGRVRDPLSHFKFRLKPLAGASRPNPTMRRALSRDYTGKAKGSANSSAPKAKGSARAKRPFHVTAGATKDAAPGTNIDRHLTMYERSMEAMKRKPKRDKTAEDIAEEEAKVRCRDRVWLTRTSEPESVRRRHAWEWQ